MRIESQVSFVKRGTPEHIKQTQRAVRVQSLTASFFSLEIQDILSRNRATHVREARQVLAYILRSNTLLTLKDIAPLVGLTDHTSVIHSVAVVNNEIDTRPDFAARVAELENYILPIVKD